MKKIIFILTAAFLGTGIISAQEVAPIAKIEVAKTKAPKKGKKVKIEGPSMKFVTETVDYGTIYKNANGERVFEFVNNGNKPLIITNAVGSCGCTVPTWPKEPIMPGKKATLGVKYDTNRPGAINKSITITSNSIAEPTKVVTIKGNVILDPNAPVPVPTPVPAPVVPTVMPVEPVKG